MRVAIITESFLPQINGVSNSVAKIAEHLARRGHEALIMAPWSAETPSRYAGARVVPLGALPMPGYPQVRIATTPRWALERTLRDFRADVVHLASPINVGLRGLMAAQRLDLPTVAVYQTNVPSYAAQYGLPAMEAMLRWRVQLIHETATLSLVPSRASWELLHAMGVTTLELWGRGVDADLFHPSRRCDTWRTEVAPRGGRIVGFVGRLAPEKQVDDLARLCDLPDTTVVIVGDGPARAELAARLPRAHFTGALRGEALAAACASFDVFVHPGEHETFGQTLQEAHASGVPVVAVAAGGPLDLVEPGRTGHLYSPGDLAGLQRHVADLLDDETLRRTMGAEARRTVEARSWTALGDRLLDHYASAVAANQAQFADRLGQQARQILWGERPRVLAGAQGLH